MNYIRIITVILVAGLFMSCSSESELSDSNEKNIDTTIEESDASSQNDEGSAIGDGEDEKNSTVEVELDEFLLLDSIKEYYAALINHDLERVIEFSYGTEEELEKVRKREQLGIDMGLEYYMVVTGINVYNYDSMKQEVYLIYSLEEGSKLGNEEGSIEDVDKVTSAIGCVYYKEDGVWKLHTADFLENIKANDTVNGNYGVNPQKYIVDYIDWYLENEDVQVSDKVFYQIKSEDYN